MVATSGTNANRPSRIVAAPPQVLLESELQAVTLDGSPLAQSATAVVYALPELPHLAVKVFRQPAEDLGDRLTAMLASPPLDPQSGRRHPSIAWPGDRLLAAGSFRTCVGYVMPHVRRARTLADLCAPTADPGQGPHHGQRLRAARQLAGAVHALHRLGHGVGSWDPAHLLIDDEGNLTLVSADSFQVRHGARLFPCRGPGSARGAEQDLLSLAAIIRRLLGAGVPATGGTAPSPLPPAVQALLDLCFGPGHQNPALRPAADTWERVLAQTEAALQDCPVSPRHYYHRELAACPWCALARSTGRDPYPPRTAPLPETSLPVPWRTTTADARSGPGTALLAGAQSREPAPMTPTNDFEIVVEPEPATDLTPLFDLMQPPGAPLPPVPAYPDPGTEPYAPAMPALPPAAPAVPPAAVPPRAAQPNGPGLGTVFGIVLLLLAVSGVVLAYHSGWLTVPDLSAPPGQTTPHAQNEPGQANPGKGTPEKVIPAKAEPAKTDPPEVGPGEPEKGGPGKDGPGKDGPGVGGPGKDVPEKEDPKPLVVKREFKGTEHVLSAIRDHLKELPAKDRKFQRYFTLVNLHNDKAVPDKQLEEYRAALTALLLHLRPKEAPKVTEVDAEKTVLCLDLRDAGWDQPAELDQPLVWREILKVYPYALLHSKAKDEGVSDAAREVYDLSGEDLPVVRLDWFLAAVRQLSLLERLGPDVKGALPSAVTALAKRYDQPVSAEQAARELGLENADGVLKVAADNPRLRARGLQALVDGLSMPRARWAEPGSVTSLYQEVALRLGVGVPLSVRR